MEFKFKIFKSYNMILLDVLVSKCNMKEALAS